MAAGVESLSAQSLTYRRRWGWSSHATVLMCCAGVFLCGTLAVLLVQDDGGDVHGRDELMAGDIDSMRLDRVDGA